MSLMFSLILHYSCFQNPCSNALKYDAAEKLVKQYMTKISISDVEDKLFQHLLPAIEKLLIDVIYLYLSNLIK